MWFEWEVELIGGAELIAGLMILEESLDSFKIPLTKGAEIAALSIGENVVRDLDNFAPLAPSTLYQTASYRLGGPLYRRGEMVEAASDTTGGVEGSAYEVTDDTATVGLDINTRLGRIADILSRGDPRHNLPARPFVRVTDGDIDRINDAFLEYLEDNIARAFG